MFENRKPTLTEELLAELRKHGAVLSRIKNILSFIALLIGIQFFGAIIVGFFLAACSAGFLLPAMGLVSVAAIVAGVVWAMSRDVR